jgi:hypothetical protein
VPQYTTLDARVLGRTIQAVRLKLDSDGAVIWVPRTCIEDGGSAADEALLSGEFMPRIAASVLEWKCKQEEWT